MKILDSYTYCESRKIPWIVFFGEDEIKSGVVKIKDITNREDKGTNVKCEDIVFEITNRIAQSNSKLLTKVFNALKL